MRHTPPDPGAALEHGPSNQDGVDAPDDGLDVAETDPDGMDAAFEAEVTRMAREAYTASTTYFDSNVRRDIETDLRQWQSRHGHGSRYLHPGYAGRSKLFVPKTRAAVTKMEAQAAEAFFSSIDVVSIEPYDRDDPAQVEAAAFYLALTEKRLHEPAKKGGIPWFLTAQGAYQDGLVTGVVVSKQAWEFDRVRQWNRPRIDLVPLENFRWDPAADWRDPVSTSPYLILEIPMYVKDVKARIRAGQWRAVSEGQITSGARRYSDTVRLQREGNRQDSKDVGTGAGDYRIVWVREVVLEVEGQDWLFHTLDDTLLSTSIEPIETQYAHGRPFVVGFTTIEAHRHYPSSLPRLTAALQREANDLRNQRIDNVSFVLNKRYFVKRNAQVDVQSVTRNAPGSVTLLQDPEKDVRVVETPDVTTSAFAEQDRLNIDFDDLVGQFNNASVQGNRNLNETVGGMNILTANANQVSAYRLRTFVETWMEPVLRQLLDMEREYEDDERFIAMAMRQAGMQAVPETIWSEDVRLQVNVGMGATNPHQKAQLLIFALEAVKKLISDGALEARGLDIEELVGELFAMIGYRDGSRFFAWSDDDPRVMQLRTELEQTKTALAAKHPPELLAAQVAKTQAESVDKLVRAFYSALQAGQAVGSVPSIAPIADSILAASGYTRQGGDDPDIAAPAERDPALIQNEVSDRRTGVEFQPGGTLDPESPADGVAQGIETIENDATPLA